MRCEESEKSCDHCVVWVAWNVSCQTFLPIHRGIAARFPGEKCKEEVFESEVDEPEKLKFRIVSVERVSRVPGFREVTSAANHMHDY